VAKVSVQHIKQFYKTQRTLTSTYHRKCIHTNQKETSVAPTAQTMERARAYWNWALFSDRIGGGKRDVHDMLNLKKMNEQKGSRMRKLIIKATHARR
jgi:hypothetical protein